MSLHFFYTEEIKEVLIVFKALKMIIIKFGAINFKPNNCTGLPACKFILPQKTSQRSSQISIKFIRDCWKTYSLLKAPKNELVEIFKCISQRQRCGKWNQYGFSEKCFLNGVVLLWIFSGKTHRICLTTHIVIFQFHNVISTLILNAVLKSNAGLITITCTWI